MLNRQNNVYKITINENEHLAKFFASKESKDNLEIYLDSKNPSFKGLKEFRLYINFLSDVCESIEEELGE